MAALAGGASVQSVVQAQLAEVLLLWWQVFGFDDPQTQQVLRPATVVLEGAPIGKSHDQITAIDFRRNANTPESIVTKGQSIARTKILGSTPL